MKKKTQIVQIFLASGDGKQFASPERPDGRISQKAVHLEIPKIEKFVQNHSQKNAVVNELPVYCG
jgi:histone acetyltransferase (RNA polymerase elongator complex component)